MRAMEANHEGSSGSGAVPESEAGVGETVEIRIKTLDSQSYTLRVDKNVAVPALKEQLATVSGVPVENQRLICRGKVLKDDQLLSAYNVEDGHTLHLVARQPPPSSGVGQSSASNEGGQGETGLPSSGNRSGHVSHSLLMGTINFPDNGEGQLPDLNRILNAVISSIGLHGNVPSQGSTGNNSSTGVLPTPTGVHAGAPDRNGASDQDTGVRELELQIDALYGIPSNTTGGAGLTPIRVVQAPVSIIPCTLLLLNYFQVVPDALTTMSQYLDRLEQSFASEESARTSNVSDNGGTEVRAATDVRRSGEEPQRGASPAALGALVNRVDNLLRDQASSALSRLASRLENEPTMLDAAAREDVQHTAYHDGNLMQQIGALLLELGRATLSLRMGQSPSESVVNSGPAIFISPTGPNPMMVQGSNLASFRQVFDLSRTHRHNFALPPQTAGGLAVGTALPSPPGTLGPSPGVPGVSRSIHVHIHTSDPGALIAVPSSSLNSAPRQFSHEELVRIPAGGAGSTLRQFLERADHLIAPQSGAAPNDVGGSARPNRPRNEAADGANQAPGSAPPGPSGMQGALMTVDETGAVRVVPVRFRGGVHPPSGNTVDPLVSRFQQQFFVRPVSNSPNDTPVPAAANPVPPTSTDQSRQTDQASRNTPGSEGDAVDLMNSLGPLLQHLAGALQQPGASTSLQQQPNSETQQQQRPDATERETDTDAGLTEDTQAERELSNGRVVEPTLESGVTSMVTDQVSGDDERPGSSDHSAPQGQALRASVSGGPGGGSSDVPASAPIGLGLGGLQPLARVRRRRQAQQSSQDEQRQAGQDALQNLLAQRDLADEINQRNNIALPSLGNLVRAVGGGDRLQGGPGIIGQLMRSPVVENLVQQVMQGVGDGDGGDGAHRGPATGGLDLSGMLQHMMPVVTQMLGGGSSASFPGSVAGTSTRTSDGGARGTTSQPSETERWQDALSQEEVADWTETIAADEEAQQSMPPQRPFSDVYRRGTPAAKRQKTAVESAAENLEDGGSAEILLRDLAGAASAEISGNNGTVGADDLAQQVVRVDGLAETRILAMAPASHILPESSANPRRRQRSQMESESDCMQHS
nr:large proline-rich protein BAG6-like isoform X6 [Physcomitrium patens]XP_024379003.1 large proline-rich protein BAG6-like isoform X6 [Physcomitrium patens]XP_024379014.1 large proline-rich protein BAG6-like isoform X6 [Physcomitrium patens]|eukprot:XP_024378995.1 large proline-rich protein BAG6-like isoform X6 [Physcomitrella patens]